MMPDEHENWVRREIAKGAVALVAVALIGAGWLLTIAIEEAHRNRKKQGAQSATIRLAGDQRTVEAWSPGGSLVWESEPGDAGHDVLLSIIAEARAADTLTTRTLPEEGPGA